MRRWLPSPQSLLLMTLPFALLALFSGCVQPPGESGGGGEEAALCVPTVPTPPQSYYLPRDGKWLLPSDIPTSRMPSCQGSIMVEGLGAFTFDPLEVQTVRPDVFGPGHFSIFDILVDLSSKGWFSMDYHYDELLGTHVIEQLDGRTNWWYQAHYAGGWFELNAQRMDLYPYKDGTQVIVRQRSDEFTGRLYNSFAAEVRRKSLNQDRVVIPEVRIGPALHTNVPVSAHDVRIDVLAPGTITALDVLLSLADQGKIDAMKLTWYGSMDGADPVDSFFVEQIDDGDGLFDGESSPETGEWVYETGAREFAGYQGSLIHMPADVRVLVSPEYMLWYWLT
jgi:hypothetical protein